MNTQYVGNIYGPVQTGHVFVLSGKTIDGAVSLVIDLKTGREADAGIPLRLEVLFEEDIIVRNALIDGEWSDEERDENRLLPFAKEEHPLLAGEFFKVYIFVSELSFHVAINDSAYCTFAFRTPVQDIRTIAVHRDLQAIFQMDHRSVFPAPHPVLQVDEERTEFSNDIPKQFAAGHVLIITAIPYGNARGMFVVRFSEGATKKQALHFNARFDPEYAVVRNSMNDNLEFLREERDGAFPFFIDEQFRLAIAFTPNAFKFAVNGKPFATYDYRNANQLQKLNGLKIGVARGMHLEVTSVDHMPTNDPECADFHTYSHPDVLIY